MRMEALAPPALAHHPLRPGAPWPSCYWPPHQWAAQPGKGASLRGRAAGPRNNTLAPPVWSPGSWQPGRGLRSALTARLHESSSGPTGQSCPKISLRPGRAGGRRRRTVGPGHLRGSPQARALVPQALSLEPRGHGPCKGVQSSVHLSGAACCPEWPSSRPPRSAACGLGAAAARADCGRL